MSDIENVTSSSENVASDSQTTASTSSTIDSSILAQFAFYEKDGKDEKKKDGKDDKKKIPVYPYVVALTGIDKEPTEEVKKMAKKQLEALSEAWNKKCKETAPLILLVGLESESERFWANEAIALRDQQSAKKKKQNKKQCEQQATNPTIRVVAVADIPYDLMVDKRKELEEKLEKSENTDKELKELKKLKEIDEIVQKVDDVIECPLESDFLQKAVDYYMGEFKKLTGSEEIEDSDKKKYENQIARFFLESKESEESKKPTESVARHYQTHEYVKYICTHSHTLIALPDNNPSDEKAKWKTASLLDLAPSIEFNIDTLEPGSTTKEPKETNNQLGNSVQNEPSGSDLPESNPKQEPMSALQWILELKDRLLGLFKSSNEVRKTLAPEEALKEIKEKIDARLFFLEAPCAVTDYMILYKLLERVGSPSYLKFKFNVNYQIEDKKVDLTFASIGPVVCITPSQNEDNKKRPTVSILVKDRPFDDKYKIVYIEPDWSCWFGRFKSIAEFPEIKQVLETMGDVNQKFVNTNYHSWKSPDSKEFFKKEKELLPEKDKEKVKEAQYSDDQVASMDSLIQHYNYANKLATDYKENTKWTVKWYCILCFIALCLCYPCEKMHDWVAQPDNQVYKQFTITNILGFSQIQNVFKNWSSKTKQKESSKSDVSKQTKAKQAKTTKQVKIDKKNGLEKLDVKSKIAFHVSAWVIVLIIFVVSVIYFWSCIKKNHRYYHYFTMIAEGLRIQIFWRLAGMPDSIVDNFRYHQTRDFAWVRTAFIGLDVTLNDKPEPEVLESLKSNYQLIQHLWIGVQLYDRSHKKDNPLVGLYYKLREWSIVKLIYKIIIWGLLVFTFGQCFKYEFWNLIPDFSKLNIIPEFFKSNIGKFVSVLVPCLLISIILSFNLYRTLNRSEIKRRHDKQLLFPYRRAYILLRRNMELWDSYDKNILNKENQEILRQIGQINTLNKENQEILRQIGQIVLGKESDWHLLINNQDLILPR